MRTFFSRRAIKSFATASALILIVSGALIVGFASTTESTGAALPQCADGIDNDGNGVLDYPQDQQCLNLDQDYEGPNTTGNFITITDGHDQAKPGDALVFVITLKQQRDPVRNMDVTVKLPYQLTVVSASDGGTVSPETVVWRNVSVNRNVTRTLTFNATVSPDARPGQYIIARALVSGAQGTDSTLVTEDIQPAESDQYSVAVTDNREFTLPFELLTYTLRVRNTGKHAQTSDVRLNLPYEVNYLSSSDNGERSSFTVVWKNVTLGAGEERILSATGRVDERAKDRVVLRATATIGTAVDRDVTVIRYGLPYSSIDATVTDNRSTAELGQLLTYVVRVTNKSAVVGTNVSVDTSLPLYGEFVSASEGGKYDGTNVRWLILQIAPGGSRVLQFTVRVRGDAPIGTLLTASVATADGTGDRDTTTVVAQSTEMGAIQQEVLFRKTANQSEVLPGGSVRYTLTVKNTLDRVMSDAEIVDRFDTQYMTLETYENPESMIDQAAGNIRWKVPVLQPGETWRTSYTLMVRSDAPNGMELSNVATLRGSDIVSGTSLTETVRTARTGVFTGVPETGVDLSALLGLLLGVPALAAVGIQRKIHG
ncbi:MAG: hypothetical protein PHZ00_00845 [Candidatus Peribacteraceae bacterium]|nr:hypothetical protein [Candidatus Peribacteraceae bacterium]